VDINQEITSSRIPYRSDQTNMLFKLYYTEEYNGKYCDDPGMKLLGEFSIELTGSGIDRSVLFGVTFGKMEIIASTKNKQTGQMYRTTFNFNLDG
jgi:hypothetical protein